MIALLAFARLVQLKCSPHPLPLSPSIDRSTHPSIAAQSWNINLPRASILAGHRLITPKPKKRRKKVFILSSNPPFVTRVSKALLHVTDQLAQRYCGEDRGGG